MSSLQQEGPILSKPDTCFGCVLYDRGRGFAYPTGPTHSPILFVGEALGSDEAERGEPFVGAAGYLLDRVLRMNNLPSRESYRIANVVSCQPPKNKLDGASYEAAAVAQCSQYLDPVLAEPHRVVVPLGKSAMRRVLALPKKGRGIRVQDFHGTVSRDPTDRFWVVPSYHPSFIQRGAWNLLGTVSFDLQVAHEIAAAERAGGFKLDLPSLVVDPPIGWFDAWVDMVIAAALHDPEGIWLGIDTETVEKLLLADESELETKGGARGVRITRVNVSASKDEGVTVPCSGPYIKALRRLFAAPMLKAFWHKRYDLPLLLAAEFVVNGPCLDFMWGWHVLQSDTPRSLGYVAPFYSRHPPWKHLSQSDEGIYAAWDAVHTVRCAHGIAKDLKDLGMWEVFTRHIYEYHEIVLDPAEEIGLLVDRKKIGEFKLDLEEKARRVGGEIQAVVKDEDKPLVPKEGWKRERESDEGFPGWTTIKVGKDEVPTRCPIVVASVDADVWCCHTCGAEGIQRRHRCEDKKQTPDVHFERRQVRRWFAQAPFNPDSPKQILGYMLRRGHKPGKSKQTGGPSTDKDTLQKLAKSSKDPLYPRILDFRAVGKVLRTYVVGTLNRMDAQDRVHPEFLDAPSTLRTSCRNPNLQNVIADRGKDSLAAGFRKCIVAAPGHVLMEADAAGIEAVLTGYFCKDPYFIKLAQRGIHAYVASHLVGRPADKDWPDAKLVPYLKEIKETEKVAYATCKRTVHLADYGGTPKVMHLTYPDTFPTIKHAQKLYDLFLSLAPKLKPWWEEMWTYAQEHWFLGGPGHHPYGYLHWFWNVLSYQRVSAALVVPYGDGFRDKAGNRVIQVAPGRYMRIGLGEDAKRIIAFKPQSTARGVQTEVNFGLFERGQENYIGDVYGGRTPLRAIIHDADLMEVPVERMHEVALKVVAEMTRPLKALPLPPEWGMGEFLQIGVEVKVSAEGGNWAPYDPETNPLGMQTYMVSSPGIDLAADAPVPVDETDPEEQEEEVVQGEEVYAT